MKIAIIGYGKMGQLIEKVALERGHQVLIRISRDNRIADFVQEKFENIDVVIEFTNPEAAYQNVTQCLAWQLPVVCGTTGWYEQLEDAEKICLANNTAFIAASNFSIGVQLFWKISQYMGKIMNHQPSYHAHIEETHHIHKKDAPSGTAITTAEKILAEMNHLKEWTLVANADTVTESLPIIAHRMNEVPGTHEVVFQNEIDAISLKHTAFSREGFAAGAVVAAEFIYNKKGIYSMEDVLTL